MVSVQASKNLELPPALPVFRNIKRYWDATHNIFMAKILPGEFYVTLNHEAVITVLGSCISACIRDKALGIGGMNHFMLPDNKEDQYRGLKKQQPTGANRYGNFAMESLINEILKNGGKRKNLEIKVTGGGRILQNMTNIGASNIKFVEEYIENECLNCIGKDLGDVYPRKVMYIPETGQMKVKRLRTLHNNTVIERETSYMNDITKGPVGGDIELF